VDDFGFVESDDPDDDLLLVPLSTAPGGNVNLRGKVKFTPEGVYAETPDGTNYGQSIVFWPWSSIDRIQQNR